MDWTLGELNYHLYAWRQADKQPIRHSKRHAAYVQKYLSGHTDFSVSDVLDSWLTSPYGRMKPDHAERSHMYSLEVDYHNLKAARSALSSFAAQIIQDRLKKEVRKITDVPSGLGIPQGQNDLSWGTLGASMMPRIISTLDQHQPLMFRLMKTVAESPPRKRNGVYTIRKHRPVELSATYALAALDFCHSSKSKLLSVARGVFYLSSGVPADVIAYNSRIGNTPSINTIKATLKTLSDEKAALIRRLGSNDTTWIDPGTGDTRVKVNAILFDNVQQFHQQRDKRMGRENSMVIGVAGTFIELSAPPTAVDLDDRRARLIQNQRKNFTIDRLLGLIDQAHFRNIGILQWLGALTKYIPELNHLQTEVSLRYRTRCQKMILPTEKSRIHPLACSGKNEANISELKDALLDFLDQLGQTTDSHDNRLWLGCGDGLSYHNMITLKKHLSNHDNPFQSFELCIPVLQVFHTSWTNFSRLLETHWGPALNDNPATLGHSAKKIGRQTPANFKKVDYYPTAELVDIVHDMRMLDCWRLHYGTTNIFNYFKDLADKSLLPTFEELETIAAKLFSAYMTSQAQYSAASDARTTPSGWASLVPEGSAWPSSSPSHSLNSEAPSNSSADQTADQTLSESIAFMRDAMYAREILFATAIADMGRVWEVFILTFAGSKHTKYTQYLLEFVCTLELESNADLKALILRSMVINLSGHPGDWQPADIVQEFLNRCLEPLIQRKDINFGSYYIRNYWARNVRDIYELKGEIRDMVGLAKRSGKHTKPHENPEVRTLLDEYQRTELHSRRPGRVEGEPRNVDDMKRGIEALSKGTLKKWVAKTLRARAISNLRIGQTIDHNAGMVDTGEAEVNDETELDNVDEGQDDEQGTDDETEKL
ncbi:hypothetical protein ONZ45_g8391 [Pleurotus djamor]|nr:hypothetical protein ONZ45_g8391 [Pleurotus djamor]